MKKVLLSVAALFAAVSLSAQDLTAVYNEAAAAYGAKDFAGAAAKFQQVIDEGMDSDGAASLVATAKSTLPKCYFMMGGYAAQAKKYDEAITNFTKSAELAELYGDMTQMTKSKQWVAKIYQMQGGEAFNSKDYATASEIFAKGYAADPRNTDMALNLAMSYCELGKYAEGMAIYEDIAALTNPKYEEAVAKANEMMTLYTNNGCQAAVRQRFRRHHRHGRRAAGQEPLERRCPQGASAGLLEQAGLCEGHRAG